MGLDKKWGHVFELHCRKMLSLWLHSIKASPLDVHQLITVECVQLGSTWNKMNTRHLLFDAAFDFGCLVFMLLSGSLLTVAVSPCSTWLNLSSATEMSLDCDRWKLYVLLRSNFSSATTSNEMFLDFAILAKCYTNHNRLCIIENWVDVFTYYKYYW